MTWSNSPIIIPSPTIDGTDFKPRNSRRDGRLIEIDTNHSDHLYQSSSDLISRTANPPPPQPLIPDLNGYRADGINLESHHIPSSDSKTYTINPSPHQSPSLSFITHLTPFRTLSGVIPGWNSRHGLLKSSHPFSRPFDPSSSKLNIDEDFEKKALDQSSMNPKHSTPILNYHSTTFLPLPNSVALRHAVIKTAKGESDRFRARSLPAQDQLDAAMGCRVMDSKGKLIEFSQLIDRQCRTVVIFIRNFR